MGRGGGGGGSFHSSGSFHSHSSRSSFSSGSSHSSFSGSRPGFSSGHSYGGSRPGSRPGSSYSNSYGYNYSRPRPIVPPPPRPHYWGWHRGYYYAGGHGLRSLGFFIVIAALILSMGLVSAAQELSYSRPTYVSETAISRTAIDTGIPYDRDCVVDEIGWLKNPDKLGKQLEDFYDLTGCQPYLYLKEYDRDLTTQEDQQAWARDFYDSNFANDPHTVMYVYFCDEADEGHGQDVIWVGPESVKVFNREVQELFWQNLDYDWETWDYNDNDGMFQDVFMKTAKSVIQEVNAQAPAEEKEGSNGKFVTKVVTCTLLSGAVLVYCYVGRKRSKASYAEEPSAEPVAAQNSDFNITVYPGTTGPQNTQVTVVPETQAAPVQDSQAQAVSYSAYSGGSAYATAPESTSGSYNAQNKQY